MGSEKHGWFKIGFSRRDPASRLTFAQCASPFPIKLVAVMPVAQAYATEQWLHDKFKDRHLNGEWFALTLADIRAVQIDEAEIETWARANGKWNKMPGQSWTNSAPSLVKKTFVMD
jgi:hypothetical protein